MVHKCAAMKGRCRSATKSQEISSQPPKNEERERGGMSRMPTRTTHKDTGTGREADTGAASTTEHRITFLPA
jgi:hypothetical protein